MNNKAVTMNTTSIIGNIISWLFGGLFFAIGVINTFWGNDPGFGIFVMLVSLVYFLPNHLINAITKDLVGFSIPRLGLLKGVLGILILVGALGVGELFDKVDLMLLDLK
jgi:hypothetical protein